MFLIKKESFLKPIDKSGANLIRTFHLYTGFNRKTSYLGNFIKISVKKAKVDSFVKKKSKSVAIITTTNYRSIKIDGTKLNFYRNTAVLIKRKLVLRSKDITGPGDYNVARKRFLYKFPGIL